MAAGLRFIGHGMPMSPSEGLGSTKYCGPSVAADDTELDAVDEGLFFSIAFLYGGGELL